MANHPSALKRHRQSVKRAERNTAVRTNVRNAIKKLRVAVEAGDKAGAQTHLREVEKKLRKASSKGVYHANGASRRVSRLTRATNAL
ncbi:MAG: 30S ribosomal protein S20 [bacterium]